jgi:hypothetical protein
MWALKSLNNRSTSNEGINQPLFDDDDSCEYDNNNDDRLKLFESRLRERMGQTHFGDGHESSVNDKDVVETEQSNNSTISIEIDQAKKFILDNEEEERHNPPSVIPFPALMVLITALLHSAVRCLVILQNIQRSWKKRRRRSSSQNSLQFSDLPFIIGRNMSSSGCSFHIFSFLNRWLETYADDDDAEVQQNTDDNSPMMSLKAVSIDRISIASSFLVMNQTLEHPTTVTSRLSRFGIRFEGIDMRVTILMKNKLRRKGDDMSRCRNLQSISFQLRIEALDVSLNRCRGNGIQLDTKVLFNDDVASNDDQMNISFGVSGILNEVTMCQAHKGEQVMSWDKMHSSVYLNLPRVCDNVQTSQRLIASSITFPSVICLIHKDRSTWMTSSSPPSRQVHVSLEKYFSLGIDLESVQRILSLLQDTPFPQPVKKSLAIIDNQRVVVNEDSNKKKKKKSSTHLVKLNANINMHIFTFTSKDCDEGGSKSTLDFFSFESPGIMLRYKQAVPSLPDTTCDQMNNDVELRCHVNEIRIQRHTIYGDPLDGKIEVMDLFCMKQIQGKIESLDDRSQCAIVDVEGVFVRADSEDVNKMACIMKLLDNTKQSAQHLQIKVQIMKQALFTREKLVFVSGHFLV